MKLSENLTAFFWVWVVVLVLNQIIFFGGCFTPYCLAAALPHTLFVAGIISFFLRKDAGKEEKAQGYQGYPGTVYVSLPRSQDLAQNFN